MQVFVMRHGEAGLAAVSDAERTLTERGRLTSLRMAQWLEGQSAEIERVLCSPYRRARQTLQALRAGMTLPEGEEILDGLTPDGDADWVDYYLSALAHEGVAGVLIVSHLPLVDDIVTTLCPDQPSRMFSTAAIAAIACDPTARNRLLWYRTPAEVAGGLTAG